MWADVFIRYMCPYCERFLHVEWEDQKNFILLPIPESEYTKPITPWCWRIALEILEKEGWIVTWRNLDLEENACLYIHRHGLPMNTPQIDTPYATVIPSEILPVQECISKLLGEI